MNSKPSGSERNINFSLDPATIVMRAYFMRFKCMLFISFILCSSLARALPTIVDDQLDGDSIIPQDTVFQQNESDGVISSNDQNEDKNVSDQIENLSEFYSANNSNIDNQNQDLSFNNQPKALNGQLQSSDANNQPTVSDTNDQPEGSITDNETGDSNTGLSTQSSEIGNQPGGSITDNETGDFDDSLSTQASEIFPIRIQDQHGVRDVAYSKTPDGYAIIDSDVVYGGVDEILVSQVSDDFESGLNARAFSIRAAAGWPNGVILYKYDSVLGERAMSGIVKVAINRWLAKAPYLTFKKVWPNSPNLDMNVLTISTMPCTGSNANVGFHHKPLIMHLQRACSDPNFFFPGAVTDATHEFGHVLGLNHEHQRPDRENFVHFDCKNLDPNCRTMPPGKTCCDTGLPTQCCRLANNFNAVRNYDSSGPYDGKSVMHYKSIAFARPGTVTLQAIDPSIRLTKWDHFHPTQGDFDRICKLYAKECNAYAKAKV